MVIFLFLCKCIVYNFKTQHAMSCKGFKMKHLHILNNKFNISLLYFRKSSILQTISSHNETVAVLVILIAIY